MSGRQHWGAAAKVVAFAAASAVVTSIVLATLLNLDVQPQFGYHADFTNASGLEKGDSVRIAGVEVGKVTAVSLHGYDARLTFSVDKDQHLTTTTTAAIHYANLLGQRYLALYQGPAGGSALPPGGDIPLDKTTDALNLTEVFDGFQPLFAALSPSEVNQLTGSIIDVFQGEAGTVDSLVAETATITTNLADREQVIDEVLDNLSGLLNAVGSHDQQLGTLIDNLDTLVSGVAGNRTNVANAISSIGQLTTTVGGLLAETQPKVNQDIADLAASSGTLAEQQNGIASVLEGLPGLLDTATKIQSTGSYVNAYICTLDINILPQDPADTSLAGPLNVSIIPGVAAPQYPDPIYLPASSTAGGATQHTKACR